MIITKAYNNETKQMLVLVVMQTSAVVALLFVKVIKIIVPWENFADHTINISLYMGKEFVNR